MSPKSAKCDPNGIKIAIFFQKKKIAQGLGASPQTKICNTFD